MFYQKYVFIFYYILTFKSFVLLKKINLEKINQNVTIKWDIFTRSDEFSDRFRVII
jgi:hypothetical protein